MSRPLPDLIAAVLDGRASAADRQELETRVLAHPAERQLYAEFLHLHGSLHWSAAAAGPITPPPAPPRRWRGLLVGALALAASVALVIWFTPTSSPNVATLVGGKACKWDAGTLPTETGARLGVGRLRLVEGLARITFDSGAEVQIEAPADLEVLSARKCVLHAGRLVAKVPPPAIGFIVETPTATLLDQGTEFGVNVRDGRTADVQVFNGQVDVHHRATQRKEVVRTGRAVRVDAANVTDFDPHSEPPLTAATPSERRLRTLHLSTAMGRGKDAYVQPIFPFKPQVNELLLIKFTADKSADYDRKVYVGIDLAPVGKHRLTEAQLSFTIAPSGLGFASEVPDATFAVYGLHDERFDDWDEHTLRWNSAPANAPGGKTLDLNQVTRLGTFEIVQGVVSGTRSINGPALLDFLRRDTNGMATFIVVRETRGSGRGDLVHGFASKDHPTLAPPTLKLTLAD
jgi:ferric-dicitrate binding protein FerR (iron transport regulator)